MNIVVLIGNLTKDIIKQNNRAVTTLAINEYTQAGTETTFIDLILFDKNAENAEKYLKKGSKVAIKGALRTQSWQAQDGSTKSKIAVIVQGMQFLDSKKAE